MLIVPGGKKKKPEDRLAELFLSPCFYQKTKAFCPFGVNPLAVPRVIFTKDLDIAGWYSGFHTLTSFRLAHLLRRVALHAGSCPYYPPYLSVANQGDLP